MKAMVDPKISRRRNGVIRPNYLRRVRPATTHPSFTLGKLNMNRFKRLKTLCFALFTALSLGAAASHAAGTTQLSLAQQIDINGRPLANCQLTFFVAGTVGSLQQVFGDFGLTTPISNPLNCDQAGRVPQHWLADGLIHIRLTDSSGLQIIDSVTQVLGPSSGGGGGGGTVDPTTILKTGDIKDVYGTGPLAGFVRANALSIGNATSGASERANSDTQNLFIYLYGVDASLVVSGGRTGNALNDFNANKTIALPDFRSRVRVALSTMGNADSGMFGPTFCSSATTLGFVCGGQTSTLTTLNLPPYTPAGTNSVATSTVADIVRNAAGIGSSGAAGGSNGQLIGVLGTISTITVGPSTFTGTPQGGTSQPVRTVQPSIFITTYMKL